VAAHPALAACQLCPHPRAAHAPTDDATCRISSCPCLGFVSGDLPTDDPEEPRSVFLIIPEGYAMTVTLSPIVVGETGPERFVATEAGRVYPHSGNHDG
jgi:hypothetical protein